MKGESDVAVIGMAGRFPGAGDPDALWSRVRRGDDCLVDVGVDAAREAGLPDEIIDSTSFVRRSGVLDGVDMFDHAFFGISRRDGSIMDPQHRHFLECVWEALESAGYTPESAPGPIGLFGGCGANTYLLHNLLTNPALLRQVGWFLLRHTGNDKDFLATTVSYRLGLQGPSITVQTACSTSLVAVHLASQSLLAMECDIALAGGVTIEFPHGVGYEYHDGEILSPDGRCRAFDERSSGTVLTSGVGVVALRRLADAIDAGDPILAVLKGSAVNNDGGRKVGFLAPSVDGHADVVREALSMAGVDARSITMVEAHGTGTAVGDPIEVAALTSAFRSFTNDRGFCRLSSTKPNIGHLDTAAGVASLIKVIQSMRHATLPPMANFTAPSPWLDLESTPFIIAGEASEWSCDGPRRAGVSSLGVGGTNAHVVVEEAPTLAPTPTASAEQILVISGRDRQAERDCAERLAAFLESNDDVNLADVSHTLITGRRAMTHRRVIVATDVSQAIDLLRGEDRTRSASGDVRGDAPGVVFMFPGGGTQYAAMGAGLDGRCDEFRRTMREGLDIVRSISGRDLGPVLRRDGNASELCRPTSALPAVFVTSLALARQWMAWGVTPTAMVGHSLGEYVAAHLAGVLSLDDALGLVMVRSELMERASGIDASMLAVSLGEPQVRELLEPPLSLAAVNASDECVVAGPSSSIERLALRLDRAGITTTAVPLAAAAHSSLLDPVLDEFRAAVGAVTLTAPRVPYLSNLTGTWITPEQATCSQYWTDHLRGTVRFADCVETALEGPSAVLVELGPGHSLSSYARRCSRPAAMVIPALRHRAQDIDDTAFTMHAFARQWLAGVDVDLAQFCGTSRRRLRLPTYAFQRERCWVEPETVSAVTASRSIATATSTTTSASLTAGRPRRDIASAASVPERITCIDDMTWVARWGEAQRRVPSPRTSLPSVHQRSWIVCADDGDPLGRALADELSTRSIAARVTDRVDDPALLTAEDCAVVIVSSVDASIESSKRRWLRDAPHLVRSMGALDQRFRLIAVTRDGASPSGPARRPAEALSRGVLGVADREYPNLVTTSIDIDGERPVCEMARDLADELLDEHDPVVALHGRRFVPTIERQELPDASGTSFRDDGSFVITGGLGGIGFALAEHLARVHRCNLVLVVSEIPPTGTDAERWLATHGPLDPTSLGIRRHRQLVRHGVVVVLATADLADRISVRQMLDEAEAIVGPIDGAIHAAGRLRDRLIEVASPDDYDAVVDAKALGALVLAEELERRHSELLVLVSSTSTLIAPPGQAAYVAANAVLDAMAGSRPHLRVATIDFGVWGDVGMAARLAARQSLSIEDGALVAHPVLEEISRDRHGRVTVVGHLSGEHHWLVDEHRTSTGMAVLPGTGHLELFLSAAQLAGLPHRILESVTLLEPLVVPDGATVTLRVSIDADADADTDTGPDGSRRRSVRIESDRGEQRRWYLHSEAELVPGPLDPGTLAPGPLDVPQCEPLNRANGAGKHFDPLERPRRHLHLGPHWDGVIEAHGDAGKAFGVVDTAPARSPIDDAGWSVPPAALDVATAFAVSLSPNDDPAMLHVPIGYDRVEWFGPLCGLVEVSAVLLDSSTSDIVSADVSVSLPSGSLGVRLLGLQLRAITDPARLGERPDRHGSNDTGSLMPLVSMAASVGLTASEGPQLVERFVDSSHHRVIASSVHLDDLFAARTALEPSSATTPVQHMDPSAPGTTIEAVLGSLWCELLGLDHVGVDDDFFDLGGHSLIAIRLMSRIGREFGVRLQLATIFDAPTVASLSAIIRAQRPEHAPPSLEPSPPRHLVTISRHGAGDPLFVVHGAGGNVLFLWSLARAMAGQRPIYGFQAHGIDGSDMPDATVEAMATRYVAELRAAHVGPYVLGGYSGGAVVTLEMVRQLQALGESVRCVVIFDGVPSEVEDGGVVARWRNVLANALRTGPAAVKPYVRRRAIDTLRGVRRRGGDVNDERVAQERALGYTEVAEHGFVNLYYFLSAAVDRYVTGVYDVDAIVVKADNVWPGVRADYHWTHHINGALSYCTVPGDHHSMFYPENAVKMADALGPMLQRYDRTK